jgi:uncharacterized membrane protein YphA (DoxX/SURF4 family)
LFAAALIVSILLALIFLASGIPKIIGAKLMHETAEHFSLPALAVRCIGALEVAGSAGLLVGLPFAPLGIAAAIGLALLMAGAVTFHIREKDSATRIAAPAVIGLIAFAAIVLRAASS